MPRPAVSGALAVAALFLGSGGHAPAPGPRSGSATGSVIVIQTPPPVRSITVTVSRGRGRGRGRHEDDCHLGLSSTTLTIRTETEGCRTRRDAVTITLGAVPAAVLVRAAPAVPVGGTGPAWQPCGTPTARCAGTRSRTGRDQYRATTFWRHHGDGTVITLTPACDRAFGGPRHSCVGQAGQRSSEGVTIEGPSRSTSRAHRYDLAITWTAGPPSDGR